MFFLSVLFCLLCSVFTSVHFSPPVSCPFINFFFPALVSFNSLSLHRLLLYFCPINPLSLFFLIFSLSFPSFSVGSFCFPTPHFLLTLPLVLLLSSHCLSTPFPFSHCNPDQNFFYCPPLFHFLCLPTVPETTGALPPFSLRNRPEREHGEKHPQQLPGHAHAHDKVQPEGGGRSSRKPQDRVKLHRLSNDTKVSDRRLYLTDPSASSKRRRE